MTESVEPDSSAPPLPSSMELTRRALAHVLDVFPANLREDTPLTDIGADSVAVIVFGDVVLGFAAAPGAPRIYVDDDDLRVAKTVGDLAGAVMVFAP